MSSLRYYSDSASDDSERRLRDVAQFARRLAKQLIGDVPDADDIAQEAVIAAWRRAPEDRNHARGWVAKSVRRGVFGHLRSGAARRSRERESARPEMSGAPADAALLLIEHQRRLLDELDSLPPEMKVALSTRFLEGLSNQEAAERLGIPRETVRTRTRRGLARLRESLIPSDSESNLDLRSLGWLAALASTAEPDPPSALALPSAASTFAATAITMKKILLACMLLLIPLAVFIRPWDDAVLPLDPSSTETVTAQPVALGGVDETSIVAPSEVAGRSAIQVLEVSSTASQETGPEGIATVLFIGRDKTLGDNAAMDGELVIGDNDGQVSVVHGRCELTAKLLGALQEDGDNLATNVSLTLDGRAAFLAEPERTVLSNLSVGETVSVFALLLNPIQLRVLDAVTQLDLQNVSVGTEQDSGAGRKYIMPDPEFNFLIQASSRVYGGSSPLAIPAHLPLHPVWVSASGYAPKLVNLDHSESGREVVVELEPAGSLSVTIDPIPARSEDFVLRFFDAEGRPSQEQQLRYPLALATLLQEKAEGEALTIELDPMPCGKWWVRLERGRRVVQGEVCAAGQCEVLAGKRARLVLEPKKYQLATTGALEGVVRFAGTHPPSGARLRARSMDGVLSGDPLGKLLRFDGAGEAAFAWELPVGDWELYVTPQQHTFAISVEPGLRSGVTLDLPAPATLTLVLVDKDTGAPIESSSVFCTTDDEYARSPQAISGYPIPKVRGEAGVHRIALSPQDLVIIPYLPDYQFVSIPVKLFAPSTELRVECERAATASIRLVSDVGAQLLPTDARIRVLDDDSMLLRRNSPPQETTLVLSVNEPGIYRLDIPVPLGFEKLNPITVDFRKEALPPVDITLVRTR